MASWLMGPEGDTIHALETKGDNAKSYAPLTPIVAGLVLMALGRLAQRIVPLLGRMAYQAAAAGTYSPTDYRLPLFGYYIIAIGLVVLGVALLIADRRRV